MYIIECDNHECYKVDVFMKSLVKIYDYPPLTNLIRDMIYILFQNDREMSRETLMHF